MGEVSKPISLVVEVVRISYDVDRTWLCKGETSWLKSRSLEKVLKTILGVSEIMSRFIAHEVTE